jgi:hypothetical protein
MSASDVIFTLRVSSIWKVQTIMRGAAFADGHGVGKQTQGMTAVEASDDIRGLAGIADTKQAAICLVDRAVLVKDIAVVAGKLSQDGDL